MLSALGVLAIPGPGRAETPADGAAPAVQEVIVTAQRREGALERTPVAISVLSADALTKSAIQSEADLRSAVPGLVVKGTSDSNQLNYAIRGQAVDAFTSSPPAVLPYIDEIAGVGAGGSSAFYDLRSIQVLKGPQGALFGRNGTGGAVLFTTTPPGDTLGGYVSGQLGNYDLRQAQGAINAPIVPDKVLLRVAGFYESRDGYQYNLFTQSRVGDLLRENFRVSLDLKPTDRIKNSLVVDFGYTRGGSAVAAIYGAYAPGAGQLVNAPFLFSPGLNALAPGAWSLYLAQHPGVNALGLDAAAAAQQARGPFVVDVDQPLFHRAVNTLVSNITTVDLGGNLQFKNIVGYIHADVKDTDDIDGTSFGIEQTGASRATTDAWQWTEEAQLLGKLFDNRLSYVAGFYFLDSSQFLNQPSSFFNLSPIIPATVSDFVSQESDVSYAGYAQASYDLRALGIAGLSATAGVRYTHERVTLTQDPGSAYFGKPAPLEGFEATAVGKVSWQFGLQEQLTPGALVYVVTRRSFRGGGFNANAEPINQTAAQGAGGNLFEPETATDVEGGVKFKGAVGGVSTRFNLAAYSEWVDDVQRSLYLLAGGAPTGFTVNVPQARTMGLEADGLLLPTRWLTLGASGAYTDAQFTRARSVVFGQATTYGPYPDAPKFSGALFAEATAPLHGELSISIRGDVYAQTKTYFSSLNNTTNPGTIISGYSVANFRLSLDDKAKGWSIAALVKNAFNTVYYVGGNAEGLLLGFNTALPGDPRTYLVETRYTF
jgi:iron complex outermembrane receptor protein